MRYKLSKYCAVSKVRSLQRCIICNEPLQKYGVIFYYANDTFKIYCWVHRHCVSKMDPEKLPSPLKEHVGKAGFRLVTLSTPCSYCCKHRTAEPLMNFHWFLIHDSCRMKLAEQVDNIYETNGAHIFVDSL